jgi:flavin-dependent thymidylate synthase
VEVKLISFTTNAMELLVGTKTTRLRGKSPENMTQEELYDHFAYMLDTIRSPFEFVDYVFEITGVSKNFTHQLVRTRTGAYQQESSRAVEVEHVVRPKAFEYPENQPAQIEEWKKYNLARLFDDAVFSSSAYYRQLLAAGAELQDARAVLPSNMETSIKAKFNLRTLSDMAKNRLCTRTQGEYQEVFRAMRRLVLEQHPWADPLLQVHCVSTGTCAFPRWGGKVVEPEKIHKSETYQCPHYDPRMDLTSLKNEVRMKFWSREEIATANPVATNGKTM